MLLGAVWGAFAHSQGLAGYSYGVEFISNTYMFCYSNSLIQYLHLVYILDEFCSTSVLGKDSDSSLNCLLFGGRHPCAGYCAERHTVAVKFLENNGAWSRVHRFPQDYCVCNSAR